jgi:hypothetical protein
MKKLGLFLLIAVVFVAAPGFAEAHGWPKKT